MIQFAAILAALQAVEAIAKLIPIGIDIIDNAMPAGTPGKDKLEAFKGFVQAAISTEQTLVSQFESAWPLMQPLVASAVAAKKALSGASAAA